MTRLATSAKPVQMFEYIIGYHRVLADNDIKIKFGYPAENNRFIFGVDDLVKARRLLE